MRLLPRDASDSVPPFSAEPRLRRRRAGAAVAPLAIVAMGVALRPAVHLPPSARAAEPAVMARPEPAAPPPAEAPPPPPPAEDDDPEPETLDDQLERLMGKLRSDLWLSDAQMAAVQAVVDGSPMLSQGNPVVTTHPMSRAECKKIREEADLPTSQLDLACGAPNMVPIYDPSAGETPATARVCIDQFEFPNIPCEYPVVEVRAHEAAAICAAIGKRLCDAHEWEGACAGAVRDPSVEYEWPRPRTEATHYHNNTRERVWSYGPMRDNALCGTMSSRTPDCPGGAWNKCGSNTYPAGAFPLCQSIFGVYDLHGNAAEHMSLPLRPEELKMASGGGMTEMKGSWFVFSTIQAHEDDCRWRAPSWHETRVASENSHRNYHLGFRCCKDVGEAE